MMANMTGSDALALLGKAVASLPPALARRVELDPGMSILISTTDDNLGPVSFAVGVKEFTESLNRKFPVEKAITPVVALYHEVLGHGGQILGEFDKSTPLSCVLALNHYGCKTSEAYYGIKNGRLTRQYYRQPKEIAAQYVGIKAAYQFLSDEYGKSDANQMLCKYVRGRIRKHSESLDYSPLWISVPKVLIGLDKRFGQCIFRQRVYDLENHGYDELKNYAKRVGRQDLGKTVKSCRDGVRQDLMMASIWIAVWDQSDKIKTRPAIVGLPWSVDEAFDMSEPVPELSLRMDGLSLGQLHIPDVVEPVKSGQDADGPDGPH